MPFQAPRASAYCERLIGSLKRERPDRMFILHRRQLQRHVTGFIDCYHHSRPHQGIEQRIPAHFDQDGLHGERSQRCLC